jgi:hypothetical protein
MNALQDFTPIGTISATTIAGAIEDLDTEKAPLASPALTGVPTAPTASAGTNTTQLATTAFVISNGVPTGAILLWSGSVASVPSGWNLCDGSNGTPDLRNRFVVGAGSTYAVAATGGSADAIVVSHTHTATTSITDPGHTHSLNISGGSSITGLGGSGASGWTGTNTGNNYVTTSGTNSSTTGITASTSNTSTGSSGTNANLPPYYALAYIMKL